MGMRKEPNFLIESSLLLESKTAPRRCLCRRSETAIEKEKADKIAAEKAAIAEAEHLAKRKIQWEKDL